MQSSQTKEMEMQFFLLCIIILLRMGTLVTTTAAAASTNFSGSSQRDQDALLAIKSSIKQDPQGIMSSWNHTLHFCHWQGITCGHRHRRVTILDLGSCGLVGSLSPYMGNLSFLRELRLHSNTLQSKIPPEIGRLFRLQTLDLRNNSLEGKVPANLSHCSNLVSLNLRGNKLEGEIPAELTSLSKLKTLSIACNHLTGIIPPSIGNLSSLEIFFAILNYIGGSIPDELGRLRNLKVLQLTGNDLYGKIPPSIFNLSLLINLTFASNNLDGNLPSNFGLTLPHLKVLVIWGNHFIGSIPISLSNASKLENIQVGLNNFSGKLSVDFSGMQHLSLLALSEGNLESEEAGEMRFLTSLVNCTNLEILDIATNRFRGALPTNFSTQLTYLGIGGNQLSGNLPLWIGSLLNLNYLSMENNRFTGTIPDGIGKLQKLQIVDLHSNRLTGKIPSSLGNLSLLNKLFLNENRLQGTIPSSLGNLQSLYTLNLSQNSLSGAIPSQLFNALALSISLNLAQNSLVGSLPLDIGNLEKLSELDVSENKLSGEIPSNLGRCTSLEYLYMEGNYFQGPIPSSLSSLRGLQNFDLSRNNLSGQIPSFFESFSLKNLNLSFNDFQGEIPMKGVFTNMSAVSVVGNKKLCGGIHELQLLRCTTKESKGTKMSFKLMVIISTICALLVVSMVSTLLFCWFRKKRKVSSSRSLLRESFLKVSYGNLLKATDRFSSENLIGAGSFGSVYKGILDWDETVVAIKVFNLEFQGASKSFMAECETLRNIRHRNLVKILTCCTSVDLEGNDFKALVYEFMPNGSLEKWLHPNPEIDTDQFSSPNLLQRINIAIDVACALDYLHYHCQNPIVHCDLKPSNILLDSDMTAHVGDFGLAKFLPDFTNLNNNNSIGIRGTIGYVAPEYGLGSDVSISGDIYSYGILLLEMMIGKRPTDRIFAEGLNLHNFASAALPDRVTEIVDPTLWNEHEEVSINSNSSQSPEQVIRNGSEIGECLVSIIKIGVACSMELPQDRMEISSAIRELHLIRNIIRGTGPRSWAQP